MENRQSETKRLAEASDGMIVIGGRESSNTKKLFEIASSVCDRCVIGAGAVVIRDIKESGTYVGVPARKIK